MIASKTNGARLVTQPKTNGARLVTQQPAPTLPRAAHLEQVAALHAGAAWLGAHETSEVSAVKRDLQARLHNSSLLIQERVGALYLQLVGLNHLGEEGESAVIQLHDAASERLHRTLQHKAVLTLT